MRKRRILALSLLAVWPFSARASGLLDAKAERVAAVAAEKAGDWDAALLHYENLFDATKTDEPTRAELRAKFLALRPKVKPNADPAKAGVWKVRAYAFRNLDVSWRDKNGRQHHGKHRFRDDEIQAIRDAMDGFAASVWKYSLGSLKIKWELTVIDKPLTGFDGWPDPGHCMPFFADLKPGDADSIFVFTKSHHDKAKDEATEDLPWGLWAGTFGVLPQTKGATYCGFNSPGPASGELQFHEWLHAAQWALESYQGYPSGLMANPDCGGNCGGPTGVPCYAGPKPDPKEGWTPLYVHLMEAHATRKMWRELSVTTRPANPWIDRFCRRFLILGPYDVQGKPDLGLDVPFVKEASAAPAAGEKAGKLEWREAVVQGRTLDLAAAFPGTGHHLAYAAVLVRSGKEQFAQARIGSDDGCQVWQDGRLILSSPVERAAQPDQDIVGVHLKQGDNLFLLKVADHGGGWEAMFRITDAQGDPLPDVEYALPK